MATRNDRANNAVRMFVGLLPALCAGLVACASSQPVRAAKADFNGAWAVKWCDKTNTKLDCGGFNITLVQEGDRICGDFGGALVNLRQTDEGSIVGTAVGNTAVLAVESMRNQAIVLVRAEQRGDSLHWRAIDNIKRGGTDIDVIASNDMLTKAPKTSREKQTCDSLLGRSGG